MHWLVHLLGIDTQQSEAYDFWSGFGTQITLFLAAIGAYHKHNCHARWCPRIGKHTHAGTPYCRRHHPLGVPDGAPEPAAEQSPRP